MKKIHDILERLRREAYTRDDQANSLFIRQIGMGTNEHIVLNDHQGNLLTAWILKAIENKTTDIPYAAVIATWLNSCGPAYQ